MCFVVVESSGVRLGMSRTQRTSAACHLRRANDRPVISRDNSPRMTSPRETDTCTTYIGEYIGRPCGTVTSQ